MTILRRRFLGLTGAAVAAAALSACGAPPPPPPTDVALSIAGGSDMNNARPAQVKVYYLASKAAFDGGDFFALFDTPEATLGTDLVNVDTYLLQPGSAVADAKSFKQAPSHVGVIVAFQSVDQPGWKAVKPLAPNTVNTVAASVSGTLVSLAVSQ
jgi:type VI secretion system protein VasD